MVAGYSSSPGWAETEERGIDRGTGSRWDVSLVKPMDNHANTEFTFRRIVTSWLSQFLRMFEGGDRLYTFHPSEAREREAESVGNTEIIESYGSCALTRVS